VTDAPHFECPLRSDAASTADLGDANAAITPSPVWVKQKPVVGHNRRAQHLIVCEKRRPASRLRPPPTDGSNPQYR